MNRQHITKLIIGTMPILSIFIFSCNKPIVIELPVDGQDTADCYFPPPNDGGFGYGYDYIFDSIHYERPYFNPNNPNEFIYLENGDLYKYTISSHEKSLLYVPDHYIYFQPKWSRKGKIAVNTSDYNIWVMNDNGDSLKKITNVEGDISINYYGEFNYTGDSLMFHTEGIYAESDTRKIRIAYNNFSEYDTIYFRDASPSTNWQKPGYILDVDYNIVAALSIIYPEYSQILYLNDTLSGGGVVWLENKLDFYCYRGDGIYYGNFEANTIIKIKDMCPHIYYLFPCYSEISGKVITSKITKEYLGDNKVYVKDEIIIMNPDGTNEITILPKP